MKFTKQMVRMMPAFASDNVRQSYHLDEQEKVDLVMQSMTAQGKTLTPGKAKRRKAKAENQMKTDFDQFCDAMVFVSFHTHIGFDGNLSCQVKFDAPPTEATVTAHVEELAAAITQKQRPLKRGLTRASPKAGGKKSLSPLNKNADPNSSSSGAPRSRRFSNFGIGGLSTILTHFLVNF